MSFSLPGQSMADEPLYQHLLWGRAGDAGPCCRSRRTIDDANFSSLPGESGDGSDGYAGLLGTYRDGGPVLAGAGGRTRHTVFAKHLGVAPLGFGTRRLDNLDHRLMQPAVARDYLPEREVERGAVHVAHVAARLLDQQRARRDVPLLEAEFPKPVDAAACDVGEVQRRRTGAPHALHARHEGLPERKVVAAPFAAVVRKAGSQQRELERRDSADADWFAVEPRALAALRDEAFFLERVEHDRSLHASPPLVGDGDAELRIAVREVGRAVERIDYPSMLAGLRIPAALFREDGMGGKGALQRLDYHGLRFVVGFGDDVDRVGLASDAGAAHPLHMDAPGGPCRTQGNPLDLVSVGHGDGRYARARRHSSPHVTNMHRLNRLIHLERLVIH